MNQKQGMNNIKKQRGVENILPTSIQNQRNNSEHRKNSNKQLIQQQVNHESNIRFSQDSENMPFNINYIKQSDNCLLPQQFKKYGKNQIPLNEQKQGNAINLQNKQPSSCFSNPKNENNDYKISQVEYCEVELNLLQKRENPKKNISSSVSQSAAVKNVKDLLQIQQRSSSSKAIKHNNISNQQMNNDVNTDDQQKKVQKSAKKRQAKTPKIETQQHKQQLTPSIERKKNSSSVISNQRKFSNNNQRDNVATEGSQKKGEKQNKIIPQSSKQSEFRLPCKSSLQNNRKQVPKINRIKTVGNEEDEEDDEYLQENFNLNDLDDNISPLNRFNDFVNLNKKKDINDRYQQLRNQPNSRLKNQRSSGRVLENIQQNNNLQQFQFKRGQEQLQLNDNTSCKGNEDKTLFKNNNFVGKQKKILDEQNLTSKSNCSNGINRVILQKMASNNFDKENQNENTVNENVKNDNSEENKRSRINSSSAIRKRIITKSSEKIKQNLSINIDVICDTYQDQSNNVKIGPSLTTYDSKGSTKHTNTIKFSSLIESQSSSCTQNQIISNNFNNNNFSNANKNFIPPQSREYRIKTEGDQITHKNQSPYHPRLTNNQNLPYNKNDEENNVVQGTSSTINWSQASSTKSYVSFGLQFSQQKGNSHTQNKNNQDNQKDTLGMPRIQPITVIESNQTDFNNAQTSPQFLKLRFKNTSSIVQDKNYSVEDYAGRTTSELSNTLRQPKKKLTIKTINPYKSEEKRELSSQSETPQSIQNSLLMSSIGNNLGLFRKSHDGQLSKSPISVKKQQNIVIKTNQQQNTLSSASVRESINSQFQISDNFQITLQNSTTSANKKHVDWMELTSTDNNLLNSLNNNSSSTDGFNNKKSKPLLRPTRVTSNERKNNNSTNGNRLQVIEQQQNQENQLQSDQQQKNKSSNFITQNKVNEFRLSSDSFKVSDLYDKKSFQQNLALSTQNNYLSGNNFNVDFYQSKTNGNQDDQRTGQFDNFTEFKKVEDQQKQKSILESIKSDAMKNMLRQSIEKGKEQIQQQQQNGDSIFELQKDLQQLKLSVQIENMNQNFATLNKNLKELNNNLNLGCSQIDKVHTQHSQSNILDHIESYHFDKNFDNDENQKSIDAILNNHQDSFKINQNVENQTQNILKNQGEIPSQNFSQHIQNHNIDISIIKYQNEDKDIMSEIEREKAEYEQKLIEEKIKFEQRQQQLQQEFMNQKQKLLQQKQQRKQTQQNTSQKQLDEQQIQQQVNSIQIQSKQQDQVNNLAYTQSGSNSNIVKQNSQNVITILNSGQKINQFTNQSIDLSFIKNPNLENEVSKLFKQDQISQILPGSSCSFLSECENLLETSNPMFTNNQYQQNIQQKMNLDEINIENINYGTSSQNNLTKQQQENYEQEIQKPKNQNYLLPQISQETNISNKTINQNNPLNFPNININSNMVNIPKQIQKNNPQNLQQSIIEEQDCEQSTESPLKQCSNKNIFNQQISNRMPPLPLNSQNNMKIKKNNEQQQFQGVKEISSQILKENKSVNVQQIQRNIKILNRQSYNSSERVQTDPDQYRENNKKDQELYDNIYSQFFQNDIQNRGRKYVESPTKINNQKNQIQLRVMTEPDDESLEQQDYDRYNIQSNIQTTNNNKRSKLLSLQRNCQSVLNNQKLNIQNGKHMNERNVNQLIIKKGDNLINIKQISESTKNQNMKLDKDTLFQLDQFTNPQRCQNNRSNLQAIKGKFNLQYKKFQNTIQSSSQNRLDDVEDKIN